MSVKKTSLICRNCGLTTDNLENIENINVTNNQELKDSIKDGSAFIWECSHCNSRSLRNESKFYLDANNKILIWLNVENNILETKQQQSIENQLSNYTLRIVESLGELVEKVNIFDAGLDDIAIEVCKYVTKEELSKEIKDSRQAEALLNSTLRFYRLKGADNELVFAFANNNGEMQSVNIGLNVYEDARGIIQRNPQLLINHKFAQIDEKWIKSIFQ